MKVSMRAGLKIGPGLLFLLFPAQSEILERRLYLTLCGLVWKIYWMYSDEIVYIIYYSDCHWLYMCYLSIHYPESDNRRLIILFIQTLALHALPSYTVHRYRCTGFMLWSTNFKFILILFNSCHIKVRKTGPSTGDLHMRHVLQKCTFKKICHCHTKRIVGHQDSTNPSYNWQTLLANPSFAKTTTVY